MDKFKNRQLVAITSEQELVNLQKNRALIVQKIGQDRYDRMVKQLEDYIKNKGN